MQVLVRTSKVVSQLRRAEVTAAVESHVGVTEQRGFPNACGGPQLLAPQVYMRASSRALPLRSSIRRTSLAIGDRAPVGR